MRKFIFCVFALTQSLSYVASQNYFHDLSRIQLSPTGEPNKGDSMDFGFSIAFQNGSQPKIIVGSPHSELTGAVYSCPIEKPPFITTVCYKHEFDPKKYNLYNKQDPHQNLCLGGTVVATSKYFMSCAPLWTALSSSGSQESYGTCFLHYNLTSNIRINDLLKQYTNKITAFSKKIPTDSIYGGVGWSSLVDESNEIILIGKPGVFGDIQYINSNDPLWLSRSLYFDGEKVRRDSSKYFKLNPYNIGYAFAAGKFFTDSNATVYAFSLQDSDLVGKVSFLWYDKINNMLYIKKNNEASVVEISADMSGSLFGAAMFGADVNADGITDLLVGAPAHHTGGITYESGALFIYLGGDMETFIHESRRRVILGETDGSRFGTAIAVSDLDGDALPEIFVSAPYEGISGVLYILSGYEVNSTLIKSASRIYLSELKLTQKIKMEEYKSFGFSLQVLPDIDYNGCDELAVGAPRSAKAVILRCVPAINASISTKLVTETVRETDKDFLVEVCVYISYPVRPLHISTKLSIISAVSGNGAEIKEPKFDVHLAHRKIKRCDNVIVKFKYDGTGSYNFSSKIKYDIEHIIKNKEFETSWVRLSPYSRTEDNFQVTRYCSEQDCTPKLKLLPILFNGSDITEYRLQWSDNSVNVTISVLNEGTTVYDACIRVRITGAKVLAIVCRKDRAYEDFYECYLPQPLLKNDTYNLNVLVGMDTNANDNISIEALLFNNCNYPNVTQQLIKDVHVNFAIENIHIIGHAYSFNVTDTQLLNTTQLTIDDSHQYTLINNGSIDWENIEVIVTVPSKDYVLQPTMSPSHGGRCVNEFKIDIVEFRCIINLRHSSSINLMVTTSIVKNKIVENLVDSRLEIPSQITLVFKPTTKSAHGRQSTTIFYVKERSFRNNKGLIITLAVIGALIILAIIIYILYRVGFFQRKKKERLNSIKRSIERESSRRSEKRSTSDEHKLEEDLDDIAMEVIEEIFRPIDCTEGLPDDMVLIEPSKDLMPQTSQTNTQLVK